MHDHLLNKIAQKKLETYALCGVAQIPVVSNLLDRVAGISSPSEQANSASGA
jgi:hypothetical protein